MDHTFAEWGADSEAAFLERGWAARYFFPHRVHWLPKCGGDGFRLAGWTVGIRAPGQVAQLVLHAHGPVLQEFPAELFFDDDVLWHRQHFGLPGHVAGADLFQDGRTLYAMSIHSDLVQRAARRQEHRTRVQKRFCGWNRLLLHAIVALAARRGFRRVRIASAALSMRHADETKRLGPELFERVYDRAVHHLFEPERRGEWWEIDVRRSAPRLVPPVSRTGEIGGGRTVCIVHDTERGLGHRDVDPAFAERADRTAPAALPAMLEAERRQGVKATYSVVGCMLDEVRSAIEADGHCIAFHSWDHGPGDQLRKCRATDARIRGYRPPRSQITPELQPSRLCWHGFDWLASSSVSLGRSAPWKQGPLVRLPIHLDDFDLHRGRIGWEAWLARALALVREHDFVALGLHDCYAEHWLPHYDDLLRELKAIARLRTLDDVAGDLHLAAAQ